MNSTQFYRLLEMTFSTLKNLTDTKGREYSGDQDRCRNFKEEATNLGVDPRTVLLVYASKHYASIRQYVKDAQAGVVRPLSEPIEGRIDDLILYMVLLKALIKDLGQGGSVAIPLDAMTEAEDEEFKRRQLILELGDGR